MTGNFKILAKALIQIRIQLYLTTEGPLQLKVVLPWGRGYNIIKIFKETYLQIDTDAEKGK